MKNLHHVLIKSTSIIKEIFHQLDLKLPKEHLNEMLKRIWSMFQVWLISFKLSDQQVLILINKKTPIQKNLFLKTEALALIKISSILWIQELKPQTKIPYWKRLQILQTRNFQVRNHQQNKIVFQDQCQARKSTSILNEKDNTTIWQSITNQREIIVKTHSFSQVLLTLDQIMLIIANEKWSRVWTFQEKVQSEKLEFQVVLDTSNLMSTDQFQE